MAELDSVDPEFKILVVDDVTSARRIVIKLLEKMGFAKFLEAKNGTEALGLLKSSAPNLVVSDWDMPDMQGMELLDAMRADTNLAQIPFIMITSKSTKELVMDAHEHGVSDFITKPFGYETLVKKVQGVLKKATPAP